MSAERRRVCLQIKNTILRDTLARLLGEQLEVTRECSDVPSVTVLTTEADVTPEGISELCGAGAPVVVLLLWTSAATREAYTAAGAVCLDMGVPGKVLLEQLRALQR